MTKTVRQLAILGSTGSIGRQSLEVAAAHPERFSVFAIAGGNNTALLLEQARLFRPRYVASLSGLDEAFLPAGTRQLVGEHAASELAAHPEVDAVVNGISGVGALSPLLAALKSGKRVALANKESIVCGHRLVDNAIQTGGGELLPVDSEQSAIFQCLSAGRREEVSRLILTASGGPFWQLPREQLSLVTVEQALRHPTWRMGRKITLDSATLFNKGLEIIEAAYLFHVPADRIAVTIHPQSLVHSAVEFTDGSVIANAGWPDMRLPIQYALTYPERIDSPCRRLSLSETLSLSFHPADPARFPALRLAYQALRSGGSYPIVFNAANEAAAEAFLAGEIGFLDIERTVEEALSSHICSQPAALTEVLAVDRDARASASAILTSIKRKKA